MPGQQPTGDPQYSAACVLIVDRRIEKFLIGETDVPKKN
jgi:hypothetical protein